MKFSLDFDNGVECDYPYDDFFKEDVEYGEGWAFFVSNCRDRNFFRLECEAWCLGWLAAAADYADLSGFSSLRDFVILSVERLDFGWRTADRFWLLCDRAIKNARVRGEFIRMPFLMDKLDYD